MKVNFSAIEICSITKGRFLANPTNQLIHSFSYDTRKITQPENVVFVALKGDFRNGHLFIEDAYLKGIRSFIVSEEIDTEQFKEATFILVSDTLWALQEIAKHHRQKFNYPLIAITGSVGKTMVKEWIYHFLSSKFGVVRSPKSYNSQLGVALSLLELTEKCDAALIEVGISKADEMSRLQEIIQPTVGVFTAFGSAHKENFTSKEEHLSEKLSLFSTCAKTFFHSSIELNENQIRAIKGVVTEKYNRDEFKNELVLTDKVSIHNLEIALQVAKEFKIDASIIRSKISTLPRLALRMETFEGINGNLIINDTYNLDFDALVQSLEYQLSVSENRKRVVIIGLDAASNYKQAEIEKAIAPFRPEKVIFKHSNTTIENIENSVILLKGTRKADMQRITKQFRLKKHKTYLEIDLDAIRHNLSVFKSYLKPETKLLAMVKSNSYGSGTERMASFYEKQGIDYLGVAYVDEGVELRKQGIQLPILVMNSEEEAFEDCITYNLEPTIYSFSQLDEFIKEIILEGKSDYPIHIKLNTGMNRLGFELSEIGHLIETIHAQPEVKIKGIYSHLSDSDNLESTDFTLLQIQKFEKGCAEFSQNFQYTFDRHLLNSEAVSRFPEAQYEMTRLGIGMYGYSSNPEFKEKLREAVFWKSKISQIKNILPGESVGYGRSFIAEKELKIAIIPVGYADGFRRSLSNGKGTVSIKNHSCAVIGRVCMDMIMVDVTDISVEEGESVEIVGTHQTMETLAKQSNTIPYEIMTSISKRVHRIYLEG